MPSPMRRACRDSVSCHTAALTTFPYHQRDPFDRLLVAQSLVDGVPLVSADSAFDAYRVTRLW
jgi:PIN domain nuclease of toxin-antitoxin system